MEKLIEDVLVDLLQLLGVGVLSLISYFIYHSATMKKLEKYVLAIEKQTPVLDKIVGKIKSDAQALLENKDTKVALASAVAKVLNKKGVSVTEEKVAQVIDSLEANGEAAVAEQAAPVSNAVQSPNAQKA
ncbi:MAG: hypothetical protein ABF820_11805 [Sporolactobacillus sp.]